MPQFCVDRLSIPPRLRPDHGVIDADALAVACDAARAAALILQDAHTQADAVLAAAATAAAAAVQYEQEQVAQQACALLENLRAAQACLLDGVGPLAVDLAALAFARLVVDTAPDERVACAVRRVVEEAPRRLVEAVAWVHPDDAPRMATTAWEVRHDARLTPGSCRLEAASGEWSSSFDLAALALQAALEQQAAVIKIEDCAGEPLAHQNHLSG